MFSWFLFRYTCAATTQKFAKPCNRLRVEEATIPMLTDASVRGRGEHWRLWRSGPTHCMTSWQTRHLEPDATALRRRQISVPFGGGATSQHHV